MSLYFLNQQKVLHHYFKCETFWWAVKLVFIKPTFHVWIQCFHLESTTTNISDKPL